jgi:preprotein translocase subunit SecG
MHTLKIAAITLAFLFIALFLILAYILTPTPKYQYYHSICEEDGE